jgi:ribulose-5-phosphate 4-epimerase/fuculose-1-phosphate aldolase
VDHTERQLSSVGIDLSNVRYAEDPSTLSLPYPAVYAHGVIYCGENPKDAVLIAFFEKSCFTPHRVVFIDDRLEQLQAVERALEERKIAFVGLRFSGADARVKAFNSEVADLQWSQLPQIVSDQEALLILEGIK